MMELAARVYMLSIETAANYSTDNPISYAYNSSTEMPVRMEECMVLVQLKRFIRASNTARRIAIWKQTVEVIFN